MEDDDYSDSEDGSEFPGQGSVKTPWHRTGTPRSQNLVTQDEIHRYCDVALECRLRGQTPPPSACIIL